MGPDILLTIGAYIVGITAVIVTLKTSMNQMRHELERHYEKIEKIDKMAWHHETRISVLEKGDGK